MHGDARYARRLFQLGIAPEALDSVVARVQAHFEGGPVKPADLSDFLDRLARVDEVDMTQQQFTAMPPTWRLAQGMAHQPPPVQRRPYRPRCARGGAAASGRACRWRSKPPGTAPGVTSRHGLSPRRGAMAETIPTAKVVATLHRSGGSTVTKPMPRWSRGVSCARVRAAPV